MPKFLKVLLPLVLILEVAHAQDSSSNTGCKQCQEEYADVKGKYDRLIVKKKVTKIKDLENKISLLEDSLKNLKVIDTMSVKPKTKPTESNQPVLGTGTSVADSTKENPDVRKITRLINRYREERKNREIDGLKSDTASLNFELREKRISEEQLNQSIIEYENSVLELTNSITDLNKKNDSVNYWKDSNEFLVQYILNDIQNEVDLIYSSGSTNVSGSGGVDRLTAKVENLMESDFLKHAGVRLRLDKLMSQLKSYAQIRNAIDSGESVFIDNYNETRVINARSNLKVALDMTSNESMKGEIRALRSKLSNYCTKNHQAYVIIERVNESMKYDSEKEAKREIDDYKSSFRGYTHLYNTLTNKRKISNLKRYDYNPLSDSKCN